MKRRRELLEYLSKQSGIPIFDKIEVNISTVFNSKHRVSLWADIGKESYQISRFPVKGGEFVFKVNISPMDSKFGFTTFPLDYPFDKVYYKKYRSIDDFNIPYKVKKNHYRECEGGGWYSNQDVYVINDLEFINI